MTVLIVGGGAAGFAAAISAAQAGAQVTIADRNRKPLKKLGVSGNGRGNLLNLGEPRFFGDEAFARQVLAQCDAKALCEFWASVGLSLYRGGADEDRRVYPSSMLAASAVDALLLRARQLGVRVLPQTRVTALSRGASGFEAQALQAEYDDASRKPKLVAERPITLHADRVIVTVGGAAAPAHGTDGSAYGLLTAFGHRLTEVRPALCALLTDKKRVNGLSGQRLRAALCLRCNDGKAHESRGEVLFGDDAVSGIASMQLSRFVRDGAMLSLDFSPALDASPDEVPALLKRQAALRGDQPASELLTGLFAPLIGRWLIREAGLPLDKPVGRLTIAELQALARCITATVLPIVGTRGFEQAQVTAGGIAPCDFDPCTLESRLCKGLYAAGEVLDVDGDCGGFNLMFAFASGLLAGRAGND